MKKEAVCFGEERGGVFEPERGGVFEQERRCVRTRKAFSPHPTANSRLSGMCAVRRPCSRWQTWTINTHDGPNHLGLCYGLSTRVLAPITSDCVLIAE